MPAVTLQNSTIHSSQNCGVRIAVAAVTSAVVCSSRGLGLRRRLPALGRPVVGGHAHREGAEHHHDEVADPQRQERGHDRVGRRAEPKVSSSVFDSGEAISAPPPKPMIARPVARPGRSGNHLISVETGEM